MTLRVQIGGDKASEEKPKRFVTGLKRKTLSEANLDPVYEPVLDHMLDGRPNVFLTGRAGAGKTTLIKSLLDRIPGEAAVVAPTGVAAVNAGGQTIHSFFRLPPRLIERSELHRIRDARVIKALRTLVIDEISMVRSDLLEAIDHSLKVHRAEPKKPFGGVQTILVGDPHQLAPVVDGETGPILEDWFGGPWFFQADAFRQAHFLHIELKKALRQDEARFLKLLEGIRLAAPTLEDGRLLRDLVDDTDPVAASETHVVLTPTNAVANSINRARLAEIEGEAWEYAADVTGEFDERTGGADSIVELKVGARVMLLRNDAAPGWVNGTIGVVEALEPEGVVMRVGRQSARIEPAVWEKARYEPGPRGGVQRKVIGAFRQIPLRLGWALTIHKAQGLTLDKVYIDLGRGMFAHGQAYVALSRARTLAGLKLSRPLRQSDLIRDADAFAFGELTPIEETRDYAISQLGR
jgi:ATP-dependent exoDNAse (exonuclease V) alpha subunit